MIGGVGAFEVIACGLRPEGSLVHLAVMGIFILLAWRSRRRAPKSADECARSSIVARVGERFLDAQPVAERADVVGP